MKWLIVLVVVSIVLFVAVRMASSSDFLTCPACGKRGARKRRGKVKCPNRGCVRFDHDWLNELEREIALSSSRKLEGTFAPGPNSIEVHYCNFRAEEKTFTGDTRTLEAKKGHISLCLVPTGKRVYFAKKWIQNLEQIEKALLRNQSSNSSGQPIQE